ncbi:MAG: methyl-accepting chemotaxis protein [Defluviitaleaceae bacterium]|nr:methyl-accepting chemotaxis protein [Defluviitaleaceae bacterium]
MAHNAKKSGNLMIRLVVGVLLLASVGLGLFFIVISTVVRSRLYENSIDNLRNNNETHALIIEDYFVDAAKLIETMAATWQVMGIDYENIHNVHRQLIEIIPEMSNIYFGFSDANEGGYYYVVGGLNAPQNFFGADWIMAERPWFRAAEANRGEFITTNPFLCAVQLVLITTTAKYYTDLDGREGAMAYNIYLSVLFEMLEQHEVMGGGYMFVVGANGEIITHPNENFVPVLEGGVTNFTYLNEIPQLASLEQAIVRGDDRIRMRNIDGRDTYFLPLQMETTGWTLVTAVPAYAVNAPVNMVLVLVLGWATFLLSCVIISAIVYMAVLIKRAVQTRVNAFRSASMALARGETLYKSNAREDTSFGLHNVSAEFDHNLGILQGLIHSISAVREQHLQGNYKAAIDCSGYEGAFANVTTGINEMLSYHTSSKSEILDCISDIVNGNLQASIREFSGEEKYINTTVEDLRDSMTKTVELTTRSKKISEYQKLEADGITSSLVKGLGKGILQFEYKPNPHDEDTAEAAEAFNQIGDTLNQAIAIITDYVGEVNTILSAIANGDLTTGVSREYIGDFATIKDSINNIIANLSQTINEIFAASRYVLEGAKRITTSANELADGSASQAVSLEELNTSVEMIKLQTKQFADNARDANTLSNKSTANATEGYDAVKQMLDAMNKIRESSSNISKIIKTIQDIAFQTNLLSLNAAVEAARAGEHGKGFSVVAEEVRNLSARSQSAASETTTLIQDSISRVETGTAIANTTSESLNVIVENATEVYELINNIAYAATEQSETISQISEVLLQTANMVQDNSKFAHESAATAEELNSQSEMLQQLVAFFKL